MYRKGKRYCCGNARRPISDTFLMSMSLRPRACQVRGRSVIIA